MKVRRSGIVAVSLVALSVVAPVSLSSLVALVSLVALELPVWAAPPAQLEANKGKVKAHNKIQGRDQGRGAPDVVRFEYVADADKNLPNHNCRAIFACSSRGTYFRDGERLLGNARKEGEAKAYILMAQSCLQIGQRSYSTGYELAKQALALAPADPMIQAQMGWGCMFKEDDKNARIWFLKAASSPKADFDTLGSVAAGFKDLDDLDGRLVAATSMVKKYPQYIASVHDMTMALVDLRRFKEAEPYAKKALAMNNKLREAWFGMCEVDRGLNRWREVIKDCDAVTACGYSTQSRKSVVVLRYKAEAYETLNDWQNAVQAWTIAINKTPGTRQYYVHRGDCYKRLGDNKRAQADWASAKDLDSGLD